MPTGWLARQADRWLFRQRESEPGEVFLHRRRVFILPTKAGLGFGALLLVLLVGATNYNLGLGYALVFLLAACAVVDMYLTYRNLGQLHLRPGRAASVFAGEEARFELQLNNRTGLDRYAIGVDFTSAAWPRYMADAPARGSAALVLTTATAQRGWLRAPRVRLVTRFPLGLFRAWSYWQPDLRALVYPFPEAVAPPLPMAGQARAHGRGSAGDDDFAGIRSYQSGDPMRSLAWRQIARLDPAYGGQLVTKHFEGGGADRLVLDFDALPSALPLELRLSRMTRWVLDAEQRALPYAVRIGAHAFPTGLGAAHQAACLGALALHGIAPQQP
ncbi:MAG: DUF58 domain-containing protein [Pseudomonadota bacterium]|nr:DUF58 domain-containing protein [Pseudomonadota bacterium]